jgi:hypothetical protein
MLFTGGFNHTFKIFKRKKPIDYNFQFGSQWWTLTYDAVMYILDYCNNNSAIIDTIRNFNPDFNDSY